jgi:hypothetical protein
MKKTLLFIAVLAFIIANFSSLNAQWSSNPAQNTEVYSGSGDQVLTKVALTSDGGCYVSWFDNRGSGYTMRLQRFNAFGVKQFAADGMIVSSNPQSSSLVDYDLIADDSNNAIVTFTDTRNGAQITPFAYRISPAGTFLWGANGVDLSADNSVFQANPRVVQTSDGSYVFIWVFASTPRKAHMQRLSRAGTKMWSVSNIAISLQGSENVDWPKHVASDNGSIITMYSGYTGSFVNPQNYRIYTQKFSTIGISVWNTSPDTVYSLGRVSGFYNPPIASDYNNGAVYTWIDDRNATFGSPYVQRFTSAGVRQFPVNGSWVVGADAFLRNQPFSVCVPSSGETYCFWRDNNFNQSQSGIYGQRFNSTGVRQWGDAGKVFLPMTSVVPTYLWIGAKDTNIVCVYTQQTGGATYETKALRTGPSGVIHWNVNVATTSSTKTQSSTQIFRTTSGSIITGWGDDRNGSSDIYIQNVSINGTLGNPNDIKQNSNIIPNKFSLKQNYPNPFNPSTTIKFSISENSFVSLKIYDVNGREISELVNKNLSQGEYEATFDARNLSSGVYFYTLRTGKFIETKVMSLIK